MENKKNETRNPIWHSPAWITAIVGLVSVFFTVPDIVGSYLSKQQDIELAQRNVELAEIKNRDLEKTNHFKNLLTVLQQRPENREMVLRFIAATSDSLSVRSWADDELKLLSHTKHPDPNHQGISLNPAAATTSRHQSDDQDF